MNRGLFALAALAAFIAACSGKLDTGSNDKSGANALDGKGNASADANGKDDEPANGTASAGGGGKGEAPCTDPGKPGGDPNAPAACFSIPDNTVCKDPNGKLAAEKICASKGFVVTGIAYDPKAGCTITCCEDPTPPPPPPPPVACTWTLLGDGKSCLSNVDIKTQAVAVCGAQGGYPNSLYPTNDCPYGSTFVKLECCSAGGSGGGSGGPPPPPPPPK